LEGSIGAEVSNQSWLYDINAIEIEQAITDLVEQPFDPVEFPR
jgi:hypothetical protein